MAKIIPAILEGDFGEIELKLSAMRGLAKMIQIDICDGHFVPNTTWPFMTNGKDKDFENIVNQEVGMPYWEEFDFEYDLMVKRPFEKIPDFVSAGASKIIAHLDSMDDEELENVIKSFGKSSEEMALFNIDLGIAITSLSNRKRIDKYINNISLIQVMGIKRIGFQGEPVDMNAVELVSVLRNDYPQTIINVDGGVNDETAKLFLDAGADNLVIGSAIFKDSNPASKLREFQSL